MLCPITVHLFFYTYVIKDDSSLQMTGRKGRIVQNEDGIQYESRCESDVSMENLNIMEKKRFMDGEKVII